MRVREVRTDADGRYRVAVLKQLPVGLSTRLTRFSLLVYKKGFVAYRHDRTFGQGRPRTSFSQYRNRVRLARWSPELSHARHLLFVGNAPAVAAASSWEVAAAAAELGGQRPPKRTPLSVPVGVPTEPSGTTARLDASVLLSSDEVRAVTGYTGAFVPGRLAGRRTRSYDTFHLRAKDRPERYDVAIRLWRLGADTLTGKYEEILEALPGSKQNDEVGDRSFSVVQGEILGFGLMERDASALVLLTCGKGQCTKPEHLLALARRVHANLRKLPSLGGGGDGLLPLDEDGQGQQDLDEDEDEQGTAPDASDEEATVDED